jgi:chemotaxis protein CheC
VGSTTKESSSSGPRRARWLATARSGEVTKPVERNALLKVAGDVLGERGAMMLNPVQEDALVDVLSIGFGRAAESLSQLSGHRVLLDVPTVRLQSVEETVDALERVMHAHVASVHQIFSGGPVAGDALLILDESGASRLKELLTDEPALPLAIDASAREVITEAGNILLNACLGTFGTLLNAQVSFSVPCLEITNVAAILQPLMTAESGLRGVLIVHAGFNLRDAVVAGSLLIVLNIASLDRLMHAVDEPENVQS